MENKTNGYGELLEWIKEEKFHANPEKVKILQDIKEKILSLSSKEGSKAGFSLEDMKTMYNVSKSDTFENIIQSLTPPTSKVEAKPETNK